MLESVRVEGFPLTAVSNFDKAALSAFLQEMSRDEALCEATYLPPCMSHEEVCRWVELYARNAWVLLYKGRPIGWWGYDSIKCLCGFTLPEKTFEREVWLIEEFRGRRLVHEATRLLAPVLIMRDIKYLVGITWETNTSAVRGMSKAGFDRLGRGWWHWGDETPGWCELWLLDLNVLSTTG